MGARDLSLRHLLALQAVQEAGIVALNQGDEFCVGLRQIYKERRDVVVEALQKIGIACRVPDASFYIWIGHADDQRAWSQLADARQAISGGRFAAFRAACLARLNAAP